MDVDILNKLYIKNSDFSDVKKTLKGCKNNQEAWDILTVFEEDLDKKIKEIDPGIHVDKLVEELHNYNDMKDYTQALIGSLANIKGLMVADLHHQFNLCSSD